MSTNGLPTREDGYRLALRLREVLGEEEFFLFPLDWGASRAAKFLDDTKKEAGINFIRYDLPVDSFSLGSYRPIVENGKNVKRDLQRGRTSINSENGRIYPQIEKVDFSTSRPAVFLDDWLGYTGQGLIGGTVWGIENRERLNFSKIYTAAFKAERQLILPREYKRFEHLIGGLIVSDDKYPIAPQIKKAIAGAFR